MLSTGGMPESSHADLLLLFQRAQAQFTDRVDAVEPGEWDAPALPEWSVADLVAHLTSEQLWVPPLLAGEPLDDVAPRIPTDTDALVGTDPLTAWETAADGALAAWADPAALDRTVQLSAGPASAAVYLTEMTADLTVHAWDLARAVGGDTHLDPELAAAAFRYAEAHLGDDGQPGLFAAPVEPPPGADLQTRLLARFGRRS
ncbi:uncharacterized protein (TIGR03086 family) [Modestobacter roseus]|uniref:Uncharacterized protein (TIGR03086 family) n=2 Tax=Modestobacter roseus TaxID=1181884 RepID=A0A562ITP0_9ACTN|nr:uncharacterized protein (TIGR03086 family) [Modestobacter roseus]